MEKVGDKEEEVGKDSTIEETCLVGLDSLVGSDQEEVVVPVAAEEEVAEEEEVVDVEAVTVADAGLLLVTVIGEMERAKGIGGELKANIKRITINWRQLSTMFVIH